MNSIAPVSNVGLTLWVVLLQVTVLLSAAILVERAMARFTAARHAVLFWGLLAAGIGPLFVAAAQHAGLGSRITLPAPLLPPTFLDTDVQPMASEPPLPSAGPVRCLSAALPPAYVLLGLWAAGAILMLVRFGRGLRGVIQIHRSAWPVSLGVLEARLRSHLGGRVPRVAVSAHVTTPVTVGLVRPAVVLPSHLAVSLDEEQLLQVLVHECAHALRRDPLVGFYQRLLGVVFWFHPLVHLANRRLDRAREELCDNHVLRTTCPIEYARTLLAVAESLSPGYCRLPAPCLITCRSALERRVRGLLAKGRRVTTALDRRHIKLIAAGFGAASLGLGCLGVKPPPATTTPPVTAAERTEHALPFEQGRSEFLEGDDITVTKVTGDTDEILVGHTYRIEGTYRLASHERAKLAVFTTAKRATDGRQPTQKTQTTIVNRGSGKFTVLLPMSVEGWPHVSFYPAAGGNGFGGRYFGTGPTVLK